MRKHLLINDLHIGVQRVTGTTPQTAFSIRTYALQRTRDLMFAHLDKDVVINGDLFDAFMIALADMMEFYFIAREWLIASIVGKLKAGRGNHDWAKDSSKLSSFDFVMRLLEREFGSERVLVVTEPRMIGPKLYMIPHMPNQDLFNLALEKVPALGGGNLLLHANYDNYFTNESDHSLTVTRKQAEALIAKGWTLVFGHEHQARTELKEGVIVTGNQFPTSVADCLNNPGDRKFAHIIDGADLIQVETWAARGPEHDDYDFAEVDWTVLPEVQEGIRFIRIVGNATAEEAPLMVSAIAKFRQASAALVITNAVKVEGVRDMEDLPSSMEQIKAFDVLAYLYDHLLPEQAAVVKKLLADAEPQQQREAA